MTVYEGVTLGFVSVGIIFIILTFLFDKTKKSIVSDEASMEDETFRGQVNLINDKIIELNDYHTFVQSEMDKKHKELLFLYQMISEKEKSARQLQVELESFKETLDDQIKSSQSQKRSKIEYKANEEEIIITSHVKNKNKRIIELHTEGYEIKEIAKILEIGQGEVRLVINLFE